jgi:hypothetical protein
MTGRRRVVRSLWTASRRPGGEAEPRHDALEQHQRRARVGLLQNSQTCMHMGCSWAEFYRVCRRGPHPAYLPVATPLAAYGAQTCGLVNKAIRRTSRWPSPCGQVSICCVFAPAPPSFLEPLQGIFLIPPTPTATYCY